MKSIKSWTQSLSMKQFNLLRHVTNKLRLHDVYLRLWWPILVQCPHNAYFLCFTALATYN